MPRDVGFFDTRIKSAQDSVNSYTGIYTYQNVHTYKDVHAEKYMSNHIHVHLCIGLQDVNHAMSTQR